MALAEHTMGGVSEQNWLLRPPLKDQDEVPEMGSKVKSSYGPMLEAMPPQSMPLAGRARGAAGRVRVLVRSSRRAAVLLLRCGVRVHASAGATAIKTSTRMQIEVRVASPGLIAPL